VSEATVSRYLPRRPASPDQLQRWVTFLRDHRDGIAAEVVAMPRVGGLHHRNQWRDAA